MFNCKKVFRLFSFGFLFLAICFGITSCRFNPNLQGKGEDYLQGEWQQDSIPAKKQLVTWSMHRFKFDCDSFYITIKTVSKVNYGVDTCMNSGQWTEYVKGRYTHKNDTLRLKGFFCNDDRSLKERNTCFRVGVYEEVFSMKKISDSLIQFSGTSLITPINVRLIKRTSCKPKPL